MPIIRVATILLLLMGCLSAIAQYGLYPGNKTIQDRKTENCRTGFYLPLTARENQIHGKVNRVRFKDYYVTEDGSQRLDDSGYNIYDQAGHLCQQHIYHSGTMDSQSCYFNYVNGKLLWWEYNNFIEGIYYHDTNFQYYDQKNHLVREDSKSLDSGNTYYLHPRARYEYDNKGRLVKMQSYFFKEDAPEVTTHYFYNAKGFLVKTKGIFDVGGKPQTEIDTMEYDKNGFKIAARRVSIDDWAPYTMWWKYKNDTKGRCMELTESWTIAKGTTRYVFKYDNHDNLIEQTVYDKYGTIDTSEGHLYKYVYDKMNNILSFVKYKRTVNGALVFFPRIEMEYTYW